jgi:hypothetical protein
MDYFSFNELEKITISPDNSIPRSKTFQVTRAIDIVIVIKNDSNARNSVGGDSYIAVCCIKASLKLTGILRGPFLI